MDVYETYEIRKAHEDKVKEAERCRIRKEREAAKVAEEEARIAKEQKRMSRLISATTCRCHPHLKVEDEWHERVSAPHSSVEECRTSLKSMINENWYNLILATKPTFVHEGRTFWFTSDVCFDVIEHFRSSGFENVTYRQTEYPEVHLGTKKGKEWFNTTRSRFLTLTLTIFLSLLVYFILLVIYLAKYNTADSLTVDVTNFIIFFNLFWFLFFIAVVMMFIYECRIYILYKRCAVKSI